MHTVIPAADPLTLYPQLSTYEHESGFRCKRACRRTFLDSLHAHVPAMYIRTRRTHAFAGSARYALFSQCSLTDSGHHHSPVQG